MKVIPSLSCREYFVIFGRNKIHYYIIIFHRYVQQSRMPGRMVVCPAPVATTFLPLLAVPTATELEDEAIHGFTGKNAQSGPGKQGGWVHPRCPG